MSQSKVQTKKVTDIKIKTGAAKAPFLSTIVVCGLYLLLFYPPFFRGLFFPAENLATHIYTISLALLWWVYKVLNDDNTVFETVLDYLAFGFVLAYVASTFVAVYPRGAIGETLKVFNYFLVYWLVSQLLRRNKVTLAALLNVMLASATAVALLGLFSAAGWITLKGSMVGGRVSSTLQYPNTLAAYVTVFLFIGFGLLLSSVKTWLKAIYFSSTVVFLLAILLTGSRGGFLILPLGLLAMLLGPFSGKRFAFLLNFIGLFGTTACSFLLFSRSPALALAIIPLAGLSLSCLFSWIVQMSRRKKIVLSLAAVLLLMAGVGLFIGKIVSNPVYTLKTSTTADQWVAVTKTFKGVKPNDAYKLTFEAAAVNPQQKPYAWRVTTVAYDQAGKAKTIAALNEEKNSPFAKKELEFTIPENTREIKINFASYYLGTQASFRNVKLVNLATNQEQAISFNKEKLLSPALLSRLQQLNLQTIQTQERFVFYNDALKIIKEHPLLGIGGGGWASAYFKYQSILYWTTEVHNHFLQVGVETGLLGLIIYLAVLLFPCLVLFRLIKQKSQATLLYFTAFLGFVSLALHSAIDFDLSLSALALVLWTLVGCFGSQIPPVMRSIKVNKLLPMAVKIIAIILSTSLLLGYQYGQAGAKAVSSGDGTQAFANFKKAVRFDPYTPSFRGDLAQLYLALGQQSDNEEYLRQAEKQMSKMVELDPLNPKYHTARSSFLLKTGKIEEGINELKTAIALQPFNVKHYENLAEVYAKLAFQLAAQEKVKLALTYCDQLLALKDAIEGRALAVVPWQKYIKTAQINITPKIALYLGQASFIKSELASAKDYFTAALKDNENKAEASLWLGITLEKLNQPKDAEVYFNQAFDLDPKLKKLRPELESLWLILSGQL